MTDLLTVAVLLVVLLLATYWLRYRVWQNRALSWTAVIPLPLVLILLLSASRESDSLRGPEGSVLLAVANDVSLSMGTLPDPDLYPDIGTRLERAQNVMLPLFAQIAASARPTMVSITAFTSKSETILAWDDDLALSSEIIRYVLSTGLLTEAGSDIGAALNGVVPLFESLPEAYKDPQQAKFVILVSDGEQTKARGNAAIAIEKLQQQGVRIISLHVGRTDVSEGLPVYDESGGFVGFEDIGGQIFSVPDAELMKVLAGDDEQNGIYVSADEDDAIQTILQYVGVGSGTETVGPEYLGTAVLIWGLMLIGVLRTF